MVDGSGWLVAEAAASLTVEDGGDTVGVA